MYARMRGRAQGLTLVVYRDARLKTEPRARVLSAACAHTHALALARGRNLNIYFLRSERGVMDM